MQKILTITLVGFLVLGGLGIGVAAGDSQINTISETIEFSDLIITNNNKYVDISLSGETSKIMAEGCPVIPTVSKVYTLPIGTDIKSITCSFSEQQEIELSGKITPAPKAVPLNAKTDVVAQAIIANPDVYESDSIYPSKQYSYSLGCGLDGENGRVMFLNIRCNPVQYLPGENKILFSDKIEVKVEYERPKSTNNEPEEYDLAIIAPTKFVGDLIPLVEHKNNHGIETILISTEEIYGNYTGRDEAEQIKYFIKDAIETYGISYVLLVGGRVGQTMRWYIPERRTNNDDGWEGGYASDLYYSDIYKIEMNQPVFDDWDSNGNDVFAEWSNMMGKSDIMDYYPDVYVGRLACRYNFEVKNVVKKIIYYESGNCLPKWYKKMVLVAGDTFPNAEDEFEGELETGLGASYIEPHGFKIIKLWTSDGSLNSSADVTSTLSDGAGFAYFAGHGNPAGWSTHPPNDRDTWIDGLSLSNMKQLRNRNKYPVTVVGGCHNSQFNVSMLNIIHGILKYGIKGMFMEDPFRFYYMEWVPECWSWWLASRPNGGSIGTIGMSSLGYGYIGNYTIEGLGGWIDSRFFHAIGMQGAPKLGNAHSQAITDYINIIGNVNDDQIDRKTIEAWVLLGDPSLVFGGYSE